ncbi:MAG TPA: hypothetical protein DEQ64_13020 [Lachnoclostridium sp.]|uniref:hypothetical protein n=1 Tax=Lacrimispora sp. TaxID=2719234 RepID=UPI000ED435BF|nr:hypothetical protein [Lacrimispora sp.]HCD44631.1 hypothetical protein [Lachnoclostridium sp.]
MSERENNVWDLHKTAIKMSESEFTVFYKSLNSVNLPKQLIDNFVSKTELKRQKLVDYIDGL